MSLPLSIRGASLDIGKIWDSETAKFATILDSINTSRMFVIDPLLQKQVEYLSVLKEDDIVVTLSKESIECEKEVVVFICQNIVSTTRLVGYHIRTLKEKYPNLQFHIIFNPKKTMMCSSCLREENALTDVTMYSLNLSVYPLESDLISQEINNSFSRLFLKKDPTITPEVHNVISTLQRHCGGINEIHAVGDRAVNILDTIQNKKTLQFPTNPKLPPIRQLILVDRSVDFTSLFVTPLTYEGLVDEVVGIQMNTAWVDADVIGRRDEGKVAVSLSNDDMLFADIRDQNIALLPQLLQKKLYETQMETTQAAAEGRKIPTKEDSFNQLQIHQGISDLITNITNGYQFRHQWQMQHAILEGEPFLDYIVERITLQDSLPLILRLLVLYSLVNGGLREKDYDTVRKEVIQTYGYEKLLTLHNLEAAGLFVKKDSGRNYSAIRNKLKLISEAGGENTNDMGYITSGYSPISIRLVEMIMKEGKLSGDVTRLLGCDYDHGVIQSPSKEGNGKPIAVVYFIGGITYGEIAALRYLKAQEWCPYDIIACTTNVTNCGHVLEEMNEKCPMKLPVVNQSMNDYNPF